MNCKDVICQLEKRWNSSYAMNWDNVGLLVGREEKEVKKLFVALDITEANLEQAYAFGADMIITHHPLLFSPVKKITTGDFIGRRLISMIQKDVCYYAMHTNFDVKGMAQLNQECLGLKNAEVLEVTVVEEEDGDMHQEGIGRIGNLPKSMALTDFAAEVKQRFQIPDVRVYGDCEKEIARVAVSSGSGKSMVKEALKKRVDVLVTGDFDYHTGIDAAAQGMAIIDAGHYGTEYVFIDYMKKELEKMFPNMEVGAAVVSHPYLVL